MTDSERCGCYYGAYGSHTAACQKKTHALLAQRTRERDEEREKRDCGEMRCLYVGGFCLKHWVEFARAQEARAEVAESKLAVAVRVFKQIDEVAHRAKITEHQFCLICVFLASLGEGKMLDPAHCFSMHGGSGYPLQTRVAPDGKLYCPFCGVEMDPTFWQHGQAHYVDESMGAPKAEVINMWCSGCKHLVHWAKCQDCGCEAEDWYVGTRA